MAQWIIGQTLMNVCIALLIDRAMRVTDDAFGRFLAQPPVYSPRAMKLLPDPVAAAFPRPVGRAPRQRVPAQPPACRRVRRLVPDNAIERPALQWRDARSKHG